MWILLLLLPSVEAAVFPPSLTQTQTVPEIGAAQGVEVLQDRIYLFGDGEGEKPGVIQEYVLREGELKRTGKAMELTVEGKDTIAHPTGLTHHPRFGTWMGNTINGKGTLFRLHWSRLYHRQSLEDAILHQVEDTAAVNGTRPEFVRHAGKVFLASADYGAKNNEVRLYDPTRLSRAKTTSDKGVLVHRFPVGPFVQSLYYWAERDALVLVQNQLAGKKWRMTVLDLTASIQRSQAVVVETTDFPYGDELEGMHLFNNFLIAVSNASPSRVRVGALAPPASE